MYTLHSSQPRVLMVDDDAELLDMVAELLRSEGMNVRQAVSWRTASSILERVVPDVMVLDVMLPDTNGMDVCRLLRSQGREIAILMLTARGDPMDKVLGLELGADDYLSKPFEPRELVARIRALHRRMRGAGTSNGRLLSFGKLHIDLAGFRVTYDNELVILSGAEFKLLAILARNPNIPISREDLSAALQPGNYMPIERAVDVQVTRLRKKLHVICPEYEWIVTVRGVGYAFASHLPNGS